MWSLLLGLLVWAAKKKKGLFLYCLKQMVHCMYLHVWSILELLQLYVLTLGHADSHGHWQSQEC